MGKSNQLFQDETEHVIEEFLNHNISTPTLIDFMVNRNYDPDEIQHIIDEQQEITMLKTNKLNMNIMRIGTTGYSVQVKHVLGGAIALLLLIAVNISF